VWGGESLTDGQTYDLRVIVTDNVGNVYTSEAVTTTCDTTDPESNASSPDYDNEGAIAVEWTASDSTSGVASTALYVRAEGGSWMDSGLTPQTGISGTFDYTPTIDGTYYFQTVATDNAGNQEVVPSGGTGTGDDSTIYDTTAPTGSVTAPLGPYVTETQPAFTADAGDGTGSGVATVLFQYRVSGTGVYTDVYTATVAPYQAVWGGESLTDGQTYDLRVIVTDNVGNVYTSEAVTVTCDVSAPESSASSPAYTNGSPIAVEWTASDSTSGVANTVLYVRPEGGSWADSGLAPQTGISGTFNYTPPAEGAYYFQTVSTDNAGNQETVPSGDTGTGDDNTIYDITAPTGSVVAPTGPYVNETQPEFTASADDATSGVASVLFQYGLSGTGVYTDVSTDTASPYQAVWGSEVLTDGLTYNLRVIVTDNAGNGYTSAVVTVTCDLSMPTMEPIAEAEGQYYNSAPTFSNFGFDDNEALDDGWYQIDSYTTWTALFTDVYIPSWDSDGWIIPGFDSLGEGSHTIYFRARDNVGNEVGTSGEWSWQFYKDTIAPSATVDTPTGTLNDISVIEGTAADNSGGAGLSKVELQVTDGTNYLQPDGSWSTSEAWLTPGGLENWSYDTSGVSWEEVEYTIRVRATDRAGNVGTNEGAFTHEAPAEPRWYVYLPVVLKSYQ